MHPDIVKKNKFIFSEKGDNLKKNISNIFKFK